MEITATELKNNLGKYLEAAQNEDVIVTKNGSPIVRMTAAVKERDFIYDFPEPKLSLLREAALGGDANAAGEDANALGGGAYATGGDEWLITYGGEPVGRITPVKKKRQLGFIKGPAASPEEVAALLEPIMTEEEIGEWLEKPI
ncbi:MAG: type II toxin-antitoxin system prevent-host-death family antitoxin [Clostridiales Family XIII bacterium]|jgi:prevent-host-death family protein|nr:type II toxin-antitoxin system prevent-host-death family antitoxin [Clostridiales Family XIII bacterium]